MAKCLICAKDLLLAEGKNLEPSKNGEDQPFGIVLRPQGSSRYMELHMKKHKDYRAEFLRNEEYVANKKN